MATQFTPILKLALPVQGSLNGSWGDTVNDNITKMVEEAVAGRVVINSWTTNAHTLTTANGTTAESRCAMLEFTDTGTQLSGAGEVICPDASKIYICKNDTGQTVTIKTLSGTGVAIPDGTTMFVFCDGTNVLQAATNFGVFSVSNTFKLDGVYPAGVENVAVGCLALNSVSNTGCHNVAVGYAAMCSNTCGSRNVAVGLTALLLNTTGCDNVAVGNDSLRSNTCGRNNTAVGSVALNCNTSGCNNVAVGSSALRDNTTGCCNTAVGNRTLDSNTCGAFNTGIGNCALSNNTCGSRNTAVGCGALNSNTTASCNTAVGNEALANNTTGCCNTALGSSALNANTTGIRNVAVGVNALITNETGCNNTAVGNAALLSNTSGVSNVALGFSSLCSNTTGNLNAAFGDSALCSNTTGSFNVASGLCALASSTTGCNNVALGRSALACVTTGQNNVGIGANAGVTGGSPEGICNLTTESNYIVMGNNSLTCALIKLAWTATSDCRDKTCFRPLKHGLDFVRALKPTEYQFRLDRGTDETDGKWRYGFLAQEVLPLEGDHPVVISADNPDKLYYTESHLIPVLVKAIQELAARLEALENA
jgi:trimeric autotransporter adhesin